MRSSAVVVSFLAVIASVTGLTATVPHAVAPAAERVETAGQSRVKLAVLVVFDQMRGDYLETWLGLFGNRGFKRLQSEGAWFTNCNYPYGTTTTGPGHASMLTGSCPDRHGIINNVWYADGATVGCVASPRYKIVPAATAEPLPDSMAGATAEAKPAAKAKPKEVGCPERLMAETVADVLRAGYPTAKTFGLSLKDRSAILPMGKRPTGAYWFDGRFVTSTYYADEVHPWLAILNRIGEQNPKGGANWWFGKDWMPARENVNYFDWLDPVVGQGRNRSDTNPAFRHPNTGGKSKPGKEYYEHLATSPYGNELLLGLAKMCVHEERLGRRDVPDLLVVSFSSNDLIGHTYGPDSPEVMDVTVRSDAIVAEMLDFLDLHVGYGQYLLAVTADHGVGPAGVVSEARGIVTAKRARVMVKDMQKDLESQLNAQFGKSPEPTSGTKRSGWIEAFGSPPTFPWVYLNPKLVAASGKTRDEIAQAAAKYLAGLPQVAKTFTRAELLAGFPANDTIANQVRRSYYRAPTPDKERSGDVYVLLKPYHFPADEYKTKETGATHGSPWDYDTHVPLLVYGPGVVGGVHQEPIAPQATAAIFSKWLGLRLPDKAEFPVPASLEAR